MPSPCDFILVVAFNSANHMALNKSDVAVYTWSSGSIVLSIDSLGVLLILYNS